jgi:catechol 2,3-dioxygenase-like lactoylglutathione lyase family enzyme
MLDRWQTAPILGVSRVRRTAEYYRDVLGFDLDPDDGVFAPSPAESDGVYAIVERGGALLHFQIRRGPAPPERERGAHERDVYLYVDQLDQLHAELVGRGAKIIQPPQLAPYGIREFVIEDLDRHRIAFGELIR